MPIYPTAPLTSSIPAPVSVVQPVSYAQPVTYAQPVQYVPQPVQYVPQPVQYVPQPVVQQPVIAQPILTQSVVAAPQQAPIKGESRVEYREFQRPVVEMETETIQVQVPKTKYVTDYYPVEYQTEYIPRTVYEQQTEYVPVTKTVPRVEYDAVEREVQRVQYQPVQTVPVQPVFNPMFNQSNHSLIQLLDQQPKLQSMLNQQLLQHSLIQVLDQLMPQFIQVILKLVLDHNKHNNQCLQTNHNENEILYHKHLYRIINFIIKLKFFFSNSKINSILKNSYSIEFYQLYSYVLYIFGDILCILIQFLIFQK
ncbi:unnamed protein product (macronuclear) [Paramecium tetraurelia]|uniref:Uncharacterized protein n=1 Tax=Paramecium tetraurelia TaxID=5888 RepID=A0D2A0_PARTE|nr:uncharacterized protein GSPATT00012673001 [Paramecium tetraurelia]CAK77167.1 unnamed protein product [Paramecium tetraurelia]|eukprot:XP_001444564.1 hypothetical protein (macronuclear) [Paramecium tetraurelia strain d4-2]